MVSGAFCDTDPRKVVFPAPKPPATTIFAEFCVDALVLLPDVLEPT
jgi:hypothetical protein